MTKTLTLPGLIDCHVHFREPGLEHKATMASEAASALAGGVHTVCEMPNTVPPTTTVAALADKVRRAAEIPGFDMRFYFGITEMVHLQTLRELWTGDAAELKRLKARCCGIKLYLDHSTGNQKAAADVVEEAFKVCAELDIQVVAHCEDAAMNAAAEKKYATGDVSIHSLRRPPEAEEQSVHDAIALAKKYGTRFHVAHLSTGGALEEVRRAKSEGLNVTCEVAPHHLFLTTDDYGWLGTLGKMNPPLRSKQHQDLLWAGIADGTVDCIATDHAPHTADEKKNPDPLKAPSGVPGVGTMLPLLLTVAAGKWPGKKLKKSPHGLTIADIERMCFTNPNRIFRLGKNPDEGRITVDPAKEWTLHGKDLKSACGWTPFEGWKVVGKAL